MACLYNLYDALPANGSGIEAQLGGTWTYTGVFEEDPATTTISLDVASNLYGTTDADVANVVTSNQTLAPGDSLGIHNTATPVWVDFSSVDNDTNNTYVFTYTIQTDGGVCTASSTITVTVEDGVSSINTAADPAVNTTKNWCSTDNTNYNLMDILAGGNGSGSSTTGVTQGGTWSGDTDEGGFSNVGGLSNTALFNPSNSTTAGNPATLTITYRVTVDGADTTGCSNCVSETSLTINITDAPSAGANTTLTVCNSDVAA